MSRVLRALPLALALVVSTAYAQDDDLLGDDLEEDGAEEPTEKRLDEGDSLDDLLGDEPDEDPEPVEGEDTGEDLLGDEVESDTIGGEGEDNAKIYKKYQSQVSDYVLDEEMIAWERYLGKYPNTLFRDRIDKRMEELEERMYRERIEDGEPERLDADKRELRFSQGLLIENINPRTRVQAGFEWGLPDYINLFADYEHALLRQLSVHAGMRHRYTGWSIETGVRYALVKSSRTKTLVTLIGDIQMNTNPAFLGFQPQIAFGKQIGIVDFQAQAGVRLDTRKRATVALVGGMNTTIRANDSVSIFLETSLNMKNLASQDAGIYRFNVATFGLKFYPDLKGLDRGQMEVNVGASSPYSTNYWMFHFGSVMGQMNFYL